MKTNGWIWTESRVVPGNRLEYTHRWEGGPVARVDDRYLGTHDPVVGKVYALGPYRVRVLADDFPMLQALVRREQRGAWLTALHDRLTTQAERTYRRLIMTAAIWGLADDAPGAVPTWRQLHIAKRLRKAAR